ncbi:mucin-2 isoform X2 [Neocloeon triangulifer]|uniref:mucin-2 isoform X2 n=1 Tax=Neocloeon triangulifer TaxID=2078957 RepID=UPI00286F2424|nr:mucin-2 isoform X2 [Neocloeon triangulifer]
MRALLALAALFACVLAALADPGQPPQVTVRQHVAQKRFGFGGETLSKLYSWIFPGEEQNSRAYAAPSHHSPVFRPPPGPNYGPPHPPRGKFHAPPSGPQLKACNPCNKVPWIPIPHAQFQDGGAVFAVVNAPQLHQGSHGGAQPNIPVYHHSPLPQGYLPGSQRPEGSIALEDHVAAPSGFQGGSQSEIVQSIPVADFISSIEYPVNVVQSPIIDIDAGKALPSHVQHEAQETRLDVPAVGEVQHNEAPQTQNLVLENNINNNNNNDNNIPLSINHGIGGGTSYQNVNVDHTRQEGFTITPSVQIASGSITSQPAQQSVQETLPPPIPTQQQPPLNLPPAPFQIPTFQQPPSAPSAPGFAFTGPSGAPFPSGAQRLPPIGFTAPQQPNTFLHVPNFHPPTRHFNSPGTFKQLPPSAEGLLPPPLPAQQPQQPQHQPQQPQQPQQIQQPQQPPNRPYRFEFIPPSGNGLLHVNPQPVPTTQAPWSPSGPPAESGPVLIEAAASQPQNTLLDAEASGLRSQWHHREINHQFQESKLVSTEAPAPATTTPEKTVTHILASDLRNLLIREQEKQQQQALNSNLLKLQNNIDSWTAQEFSNPDTNNIVDDPQKQATTVAAATSAKAIPNDYFPTSPSYFRPTPRPTYFDHEPSGSIAHNVHAKIFSKGGIIKHAVRPKVAETTTTTLASTTTEETTTEFTTDYPTTTPEPRRTTSWDHVAVGFSKSSNEKVYVVTPMSTHLWTAVTTDTPKIPTTSTEKSAKGYFVKSKAATKFLEATPTTKSPVAIDASAFRSPRFTVRPTIASVAQIVDVRTSTPPSRGNRFYTVPTPDPFEQATTTNSPVTAERRSSVSLDLTTVPTYSPPDGQSVQTATGHSKVVTVVTSESSSSSVSQKKATRLSIKPVKVEKASPQKQDAKEDEEEVVAAVREVSAVDLKRKPIAFLS